jgi:hypothetical protein
MTHEEIFEQCDGYFAISEELYKKNYVYKEKEDNFLFPFQKHDINKDSILPSCVYLLYPNSTIQIDFVI